MNIIIAEKLGKVRSALRLLIEQELGGQVVGEASSASDLIQTLSSTPADLLVLDWGLPDLVGADRIEKVRALSPDLKVIAICSHGSEGEIIGADSIISKGDLPQRVLAVLRSFEPAGDLARDLESADHWRED